MCFWAVRELGLAGTVVGREIGLVQSAVSKAVERGAELAAEHDGRPASWSKRVNQLLKDIPRLRPEWAKIKRNAYFHGRPSVTYNDGLFLYISRPKCNEYPFNFT